MSNFRPINRDTAFLFPPSVDEWLPERHLARFVVEVIDGLDLSEMVKAYRGSGIASYHPSMLLGLVIYGYSVSRRMPRIAAITSVATLTMSRYHNTSLPAWMGSVCFNQRTKSGVPNEMARGSMAGNGLERIGFIGIHLGRADGCYHPSG